MQESLVIMREPGNPEIIAELRRRYRVTVFTPPRMLSVLADEGQVDELRRMPGVESVVTDSGAPLPATLGEKEQLFAQAWQMRQRFGEKSRPGEGLPWDTEGFLPPDKPEHH